MKKSLDRIEQTLLSQCDGHIESISLFSGISLSFYSVRSNRISICHPPWKQLLAVNYCAAGRIDWDMKKGKPLSLGPGDFSVHLLDRCADSEIRFPSGSYDGLSLWVDLEAAETDLPAFLSEAGFSLSRLAEKFCEKETPLSFAGSAQTTSLFSGFTQKADQMGLAMQRVKCLELLLYLLQMPMERSKPLREYQWGLVEIVHKIHDQLTLDMDKRITIEELSRQYGVNPTTLKAVFKSVYGNSLAAHMKEHRMEYAAQLLRETEDSIAQISQKTGYESQSKFTIAFKAAFHMLPREYRKTMQEHHSPNKEAGFTGEACCEGSHCQTDPR